MASQLWFFVGLFLFTLEDAKKFCNGMIGFVDMTGLEPMLKSTIGELSHKNVPMVKVGVGFSFGDV